MEEEDFFDEPGEEEESRESSTIYYNSDDYISSYKISEDSTVPHNILEFHHSFGYDCRKYFNLCVADPNTLIWGSGNLIHFYNVETKELIFRRCSTGGGIGHITKNSMFEVLAVGENGINPPIIIYEWPTLEIITILRDGTTRSFSSLRFSPDGTLLVSQGGEPDFLITIWDWQKSRVRLRSKSHAQEIYNVVFSNYFPGQLATCGLGHIKTWKMAETFTGLKLQGELGRFGKTEISDIVGVYPMPDEKVLSGCEWGNILVWDETLIKIEVCRKNMRPCHDGYITQFEFIDDELITVGSDGWIRFWYYETIDQAEPTDESNYCDVEPILEIPVGQSETVEDEEETENVVTSMLLQIIKRDDKNTDEALWYAQDGNGGVWLVDLNVNDNQKPKKLFACHAGRVMDMAVADWGPYIAAIDEDGYVLIYNYQDKALKVRQKFPDKGSCITWLPTAVESSGCTLVCGFTTGIIRMCIVNMPKVLVEPDHVENEDVGLILAIKPHTQNVTRIKVNPTYTILVTGSADATIFVFKLEPTETNPNLVPIGYVPVPTSVSYLIWKPNTTSTLLIACTEGDCVLVDLPEEPQEYTKTSLKLTESSILTFKFKSVKSSILREQARVAAEEARAQKILEKKAELKAMLEANPGIEIDEQIFIESDLDDETPLPEIYIPPVPNKVLGVFFTPRNTIVLFMAGYDAGYTYEYTLPEPDTPAENIRTELMADIEGKEIRSFLFLHDRKYIVFGMEDGVIRVCKVNPEDDMDFSDWWSLPMHDNNNGFIPNMRLSYDEKVLLTCGYDGNVFSYKIHDEVEEEEEEGKKAARRSTKKKSKIFPVPKKHPEMPEPLDFTEKDIDADSPSLEEVVVRIESDRVATQAKEDKETTLETLRNLTEEYQELIKKNNALPLSQRLTDEDLEIDQRISDDLSAVLKEHMDQVYHKLAYDEEKSRIRLQKLMNHFIVPITCLPFAVKRLLTPDTMVHSLRELKLTEDYAYEPVVNDGSSVYTDDHKVAAPGPDSHSMVVSELTLRSERSVDNLSETSATESRMKLRTADSFLKGLSPHIIQNKLGEEINQMLKKYRALRSKLEEKEIEWRVLLSEKPAGRQLNSEDEAIIREAKNTIGDFKLKANLQMPDDPKDVLSVQRKFQKIVTCRRKIHFRREDFNERLRAVREKKLNLKTQVEGLTKKLINIHAEISREYHKPLPPQVNIDQDLEYPEKNLEMEEYRSMADRVKDSKKRKQMHEIDPALLNFDEEYEVLLMNESYFRPGKFVVDSKKNQNVKMVRVAVSADVITALKRDENTNSQLERELKRNRAMRKRHEQDQILEYIYKCYEALDIELDDLETERIKIVYESSYMDLFLLTMHQQLIVLRRFEDMEKDLTRICQNKKKFIENIDVKMKKMQDRMDEKNVTCAKLQEKIKDGNVRYLDTIAENRFAVFLKRIVKKKYRPPRPDDASSSSSESEESSSSEEEGEEAESASDDSETIALMNLDENLFPEGCDRGLYDEAFAVRSKRYEMEHRIRDEQRAIESLTKELDVQRKRKRTNETELAVEQQKLDALLAEKQTQLNDIDVTVVLRLSQLQCFIGDKAEKIQNCILFEQDRLSRLYARVGELNEEIQNQREMHKSDRAHLKKMENDCKAMKNELKLIKRDIKKEMMQKFGQQLSLLSLYDSVLRRLIYEIKANTGDIIKFYDEKIKIVKNEYKQQLQLLNNLIQDNTEKLSFLTVLEEELTKLNKAMNAKLVSEEELCQLEKEYGNDLHKLKTILNKHELQKEQLRLDIRRLTHKSKNLPPLEDKPCKPIKMKIYDTTKPEYPKSCFLQDSTQLSFAIDDSEYYKKIIAVRHLLSQLNIKEKTDVKETIQKMLEEIASTMRMAGYSEEEIDKNISEIIDVTSDEGADSSKEREEDDFSENQ